jgi:hypothetical protein
MKRRRLPGREPRVYSLRNVSIAPAFLRALTRKRTIGLLRSYLGTVMRDFFFLQFGEKFGFEKIDVINVDHPLDAVIPFEPERVSVYLDFVAFWIRPLGFIGKRFGKEAELEYMARFLAILERCYSEAAKVYRFRMTTTERPKYYKGRFLTIHLFDPHYLCVPSLHIIVVVLAYTFYRKAFAELGMKADEAEALGEELLGGAIGIAETVLYIKQHSVNCIPAALYAMTRITPEDVTPIEVSAFVGRLFADSPTIAAEDAERVRMHIMNLYEQLLLEGCYESDWIAPVQRWLLAYPCLSEREPEA